MSEENKSMEDIFDLIHRKQAEKLLQLLESDEPLTAQELNAISKFLSDNNITGVRNKGTGLDTLANQFEAYESGKFTPPRRTQ